MNNTKPEPCHKITQLRSRSQFIFTRVPQPGNRHNWNIWQNTWPTFFIRIEGPEIGRRRKFWWKEGIANGLSWSLPTSGGSGGTALFDSLRGGTSPRRGPVRITFVFLFCSKKKQTHCTYMVYVTGAQQVGGIWSICSPRKFQNNPQQFWHSQKLSKNKDRILYCNHF